MLDTYQLQYRLAGIPLECFQETSEPILDVQRLLNKNTFNVIFHLRKLRWR